MTPRDHDVADVRSSGETNSWPLVLCAVAAMLPVVLPTLVVMSPRRWFDVDPRAEGAEVFTAVGPVGFATLCLWGVVTSMVTLVLHRATGGRVHRWLSGAVLLGALVCWWHTGKDSDDLRYAVGWSSAAMVGLAVFHLAQHASARRWILAIMAASVVAMFVDAGVYRAIEHPMTVQHFIENKAETLAANGWGDGSPAAQLFERRLRTNDAVGPIGLSNVFGSVAGSGAVLALGIAWSAWYARQRGVGVALLGVALLGITTVWLTNSSGAKLGVCAALGIMAMSLWKPAQRWVSAVAILAVAMAYSAVILRGFIGPPPVDAGVTSGASLSILFRAWYWLAGWRIWTDSLATMVMGSGVSGFGQAYLWAKHPLSPEEVSSAHNVLVDFLVMLGVAGVAWSAALLWSLWRAGRVVEANDRETQHVPGERTALYGALLVGGGLFVLKLMVEQAEIPLEIVLVWMFTAGAFIAVMVTVLRCNLLHAHVGLLGGAVVLMVHNQIEMTFFQPASAAWAWCMVMLAAGGAVKRDAGHQVTNVSPLRRAGDAVLMVAMVVVAGSAARGLLLQQRHGAELSLAAIRLRDPAQRRASGQEAIDALQRASMIAGVDVVALRWWLGLSLSMEGDVRTSDPAIQQHIQAARALRARPAAIDRLEAQWRRVIAERSGDPSAWRAVAAPHERAAALSPYNPEDAVSAGEAWLLAGERDRAAKWFEKARALNAQLYLDPAKRVAVPEL